MITSFGYICVHSLLEEMIILSIWNQLEQLWENKCLVQTKKKYL
jgi:hypothetical protein